jgi:hypothetical protein
MDEEKIRRYIKYQEDAEWRDKTTNYEMAPSRVLPLKPPPFGGDC